MRYFCRLGIDRCAGLVSSRSVLAKRPVVLVYCIGLLNDERRLIVYLVEPPVERYYYASGL